MGNETKAVCDIKSCEQRLPDDSQIVFDLRIVCLSCQHISRDSEDPMLVDRTFTITQKSSHLDFSFSFIINAEIRERFCHKISLLKSFDKSEWSSIIFSSLLKFPVRSTLEKQEICLIIDICIIP